MENRRKAKRIQLRNDIREAENFISRSQETIERLKNSKFGITYIKKQVDKLSNAIEEKQRLVDNNKTDLTKISQGLLDNQINKEYQDVSDILKQKTLERQRIKREKAQDLRKKKEKSKKYWQGILQASRSQRQKERDYTYGYRYYCKVTDQLPDYMRKNLSGMPNNKGYIWRGIHFYGDLHAQPGPVVLFEKQKGGILVIHEYTKTEYKKYEKRGRDMKRLVYSEPRRRKKSTYR